MTDRTEHIVRTIAIAVLLIAAGVGAALAEGELRATCLGALGVLLPAAYDALRILRRGGGGAPPTAAGIVFLALLAACGGSAPKEGARTAADVARGVVCDRLEERIASRCAPDCGPEDHQAVDCVRAACTALHEELSRADR